MAESKEKTMIEDLVALQKALPVMPKDTSNPFFKSKYTSLDTITELVFPIMTKFNFAWVTMPSFTEAGEPTLAYSLMHVSGNKIDGEMKLQLAKADPQGQGSAITYARRYAITSVLGIVSDADDDGNAARAAAEAAKHSYNPAKPPEEPSRDIQDAPMTDLDKEVLKEAISRSKRFKDAAEIKAFYYDILGKEVPTTESDVDKLVEALKEKK